MRDVIPLMDRRHTPPTSFPLAPWAHDRDPMTAPRPLRAAVVVPLVDTPHVLIVDDDLVTRNVLRELLVREGYVVREGRDGREALSVLSHSPQPYVVLLDYMMPWLTGGDVLEVVARQEWLSRDRAFLLMSACAPAPIRATRLLGGQSIPFLRKPFDLTLVVDEIATAAHRLFGR